MLEFKVTGQRLVRVDNFAPATDSEGYLQAVFTFTADWEGTAKTALFWAGGSDTKYRQLLDSSGRCIVPTEVLLASGRRVDFHVTVYGVSAGVPRITTNELRVELSRSGYGGAESPAEPTADVYAQILAAYADAQNDLGRVAQLSAQLFDSSDVTMGQYLEISSDHTAFEAKANANYCYCNRFIPVRYGETIYVTPAGTTFLCFYMADQVTPGSEMASKTLNAANGYSYTVDNAQYKYMRVSVKCSEAPLESYMVNAGTGLHAYQPYGVSLQRGVEIPVLADLEAKVSNLYADPYFTYVDTDFSVIPEDFTNAGGFTASASGLVSPSGSGYGANIYYNKMCNVARKAYHAEFTFSALGRLGIGTKCEGLTGASSSLEVGLIVEIDGSANTVTIKTVPANDATGSMTTLLPATDPGFTFQTGVKYAVRIRSDYVRRLRVEVYNVLRPGEFFAWTNDYDTTGLRIKTWGGGCIWALGAAFTVSRFVTRACMKRDPVLAVFGDSWVDEVQDVYSYARMIEDICGDAFIAGRSGGYVWYLEHEANTGHDFEAAGVPKYAVLQIGTNDSTGLTVSQFKAGLTTAASKLQSLGVTPILVTICGRNGNSAQKAWVEEVNAWIKASGYKYLDIYSALCDSAGDPIAEYFCTDLVHANTEGNKVILRLLASMLPDVFAQATEL